MSNSFVGVEKMPASKDQESEEGDGIKGFIYKSGELPQLMLNVDPDGKPWGSPHAVYTLFISLPALGPPGTP